MLPWLSKTIVVGSELHQRVPTSHCMEKNNMHGTTLSPQATPHVLRCYTSTNNHLSYLWDTNVHHRTPHVCIHNPCPRDFEWSAFPEGDRSGGHQKTDCIPVSSEWIVVCRSLQTCCQSTKLELWCGYDGLGTHWLRNALLILSGEDPHNRVGKAWILLSCMALAGLDRNNFTTRAKKKLKNKLRQMFEVWYRTARARN